MINKQMVNDALKKVFADMFVGLWWSIAWPGLDYRKPEDLWEEDPSRVLEYAQNYLEDSFS